MADLRVAVEPDGDQRPTQRIYLDGHPISGVRRVRVSSERGSRTASVELDLDAVSIDPRTVSNLAVRGGGDEIEITSEADNLDGPVAPRLLPAWTRGPARAYRRPDAFDRARDVCARVGQFDWLVVFGLIFFLVTILGVCSEDTVLNYANNLRRSPDGE